MKPHAAGSFTTQLAWYAGIFPVNAYLVREADGLTLIDAGLPFMASAIVAAAKALGAPIVRMAITHAHGDHIGAVDALSAALPEVQFASSARDARFLRGEMALDPDEPQVPLKGAFQRITRQPDRLLMPGDHLGSLRVIAAPGHTPGQIAFFDERDQTLIAGDAFQSHPSLAVAGTLRWRFPFPALATWHRPTALATARHLLELQPSRLALGHGPVVEQPAAPMRAAISEAAAQIAGAANG